MEDTSDITVKDENTDSSASENKLVDTSKNLVDLENKEPLACENGLKDTSDDTVKIENTKSPVCESGFEDPSNVTVKIENTGPPACENGLVDTSKNLVDLENKEPLACENVLEDTSDDTGKIENTESSACKYGLEDPSNVTVKIENTRPPACENGLEDTSNVTVKMENRELPACENGLEDSSEVVMKIKNIDTLKHENRLEDASEVIVKIETRGSLECENRLGTCEVCGECPAKYTCPRCETKSCSLTCVKTHKSELVCSGERDKTAFKRLSEFTNLDLLSDYRMLEETTRSVENYRRDTMKNFTRWNRRLAVHLSRLRDAVTCRGARLLFLPQHFARHKNNTTYFDWKTQKISWRIEWVFPQAEFVKAVDNRALEDTRVSALINKYLDCKSCPEELQDNLQFYQSAGLSKICLLLKAEHVKKSSARFFEIDTSMTLKSVLRNKTIIEFPMIYVVLKDHKEMFEVVGSDYEEEESEQDLYHREDRSSYHHNHHHQQHPRFRYQSGGRDFKRKRQKNLLFNESGSDGSMSDDCSPSKRPMKREVDSEAGFNIPDYNELIHQNQ